MFLHSLNTGLCGHNFSISYINFALQVTVYQHVTCNAKESYFPAIKQTTELFRRIYFTDCSASIESPARFHSLHLGSSAGTFASPSSAPNNSALSMVSLPVFVSTSPAKISRPAELQSSWVRAVRSAFAATFFSVLIRFAASALLWLL